MHHVVIIGGGFGGLRAAQNLGRAPVQVTLIDRQNFHLFQPLLYQVATGGLSPANITAPLRSLLKQQENTTVLLEEVRNLNLRERSVELENRSMIYDTLVVAAGARQHYFGHDHWKKFAPGLKTIEDAVEIRKRVLLAFEMAEREEDPLQRKIWMTFVVVGAGPTGVEMAGALCELAHHTLKKEFRHIDPARSEIWLIENSDRILGPYDPFLSAKAEKKLIRLGAKIKKGYSVINIESEQVQIQSGNLTDTIFTRNVLWTAGVRGSPLAQVLGKQGIELDRSDRVKVEKDLTIPNHGEIFVIGDLAHCVGQNGKPLPGLAPVAMQQGSYVAQLIQRRLEGKSLPPFRYRDHGQMATIGRAAAIFEYGNVRFNGFLAWLIWLFVHLMYLVQFQNRVLVFIQWAWNYFTRNRSARLITAYKANTV
jgi:NADH:ubiquinone reductase (H+-translocating)